MAANGYEAVRERTVRHFLDKRIDAFLGNSSNNKTRDTVILLPGIMGSQLKFLRNPFLDGKEPDFENPKTSWVDNGIWNEAEALRLYIDPGTGRDGFYGEIPARDYVMYGDGRVHWDIKKGNLGYLAYYDELEAFLYRKSWNYFSFGFDWRRSPLEAVVSLKHVVSRLGNAGYKPERIHLVGHSMGGLVAKLFLNNLDGAAPGSIGQVITVGAPFYGGSPFLETFYYGHKDLVRQLNYQPDQLAAVVHSLYGAYCLLYLDEATFKKVGTMIGLSEYPLQTHGSPGQAADPLAASSFGRYPQLIPGAARAEFIRLARELKDTVLQDLKPAAMAQFWNIRSGMDAATPTSLWWKNVDGTKFVPPRNKDEYEKAMMDPVVSTRSTSGAAGDTKKSGDGVVPYWSAAIAQMLAGNPGHVVDMKQNSNKTHAELLRHAETLAAIEGIIEKGKPLQVS